MYTGHPVHNVHTSVVVFSQAFGQITLKVGRTVLVRVDLVEHSVGFLKIEV